MPANLRIIYDNAADRAAISAASSAGAMTPDRLQNDMKSDVWRSTSATATLTLSWPTVEPVAGVALCYSNLSSQAQMRVTAYGYAGDLVADTGWQLACPPKTIDELRWGVEPLAMHAYLPRQAIAQCWIAPVLALRLVIELMDPSSQTGYIEAGRAVVGDYWSPERSADLGVSIGMTDTSKHYRTGGGDLLTDMSTRHRKQNISLSMMRASDRDRFWDVVWGGGLARPFYFSLYPDSLDVRLEQTHSMYCKLAVTPVMTTPFFNRTSAAIELEEI
ncbi:hypothetical protein [Undibacterium curvum]|uniref:Minor tail protein n=1 Tax=Undibacterium curvum TaxID=2762294 RepID=A0ABR7A4Y4_9BURK|nr:hypothetical protein [Undibacterium curvum]MBC3931970.1 hypothetical protein [Undibacterium curvum]